MFDGCVNENSTESERHSESEVKAQPSQVLPPNTQAVKEVEDNYRSLSILMKKFDQEMGSFSGHMEQITNDASNFAGLTKLWEEQAKMIEEEINEFQMEIDSVKETSSKKREV